MSLRRATAHATSSCSRSSCRTRRGSLPRSKRSTAHTSPRRCTASFGSARRSFKTSSWSCSRRRRSTRKSTGCGICPRTRETSAGSSSRTSESCGTRNWRRISTSRCHTCR
eukprot:Amastigsp_a508381_14.p3 type:complete len:111 gc:universal Amastigsp_a508381_14:933-601(-)